MTAVATCNFCGQEFGNAQAVRAHLKACAAYLNRPRQQPEATGLRQPSLRRNSLGSDSLRSIQVGDDDRETPDSDLVHQLDNRIAEEERRLKLRGLEDAHAELDRREDTRKRVLQNEADKVAQAQDAARQEQTMARERSLQSRQAQERRAQDEQQRRERRRAAIQKVKQDVFLCWGPGAFIDSTLKATILREIETTLASLPVEEIPNEELVLMAAGVRDRLYGQAKRAEERVRQAEQETAERRQRLAQHGRDYFQRVLREEVDSLNFSERWRIERDVEEELATVKGDESKADIEDLVEEVLERHGLADDAEDVEEDDEE